jgi:hypothetical protein
VLIADLGTDGRDDLLIWTSDEIVYHASAEPPLVGFIAPAPLIESSAGLEVMDLASGDFDGDADVDLLACLRIAPGT